MEYTPAPLAEPKPAYHSATRHDLVSRDCDQVSSDVRHLRPLQHIRRIGSRRAVIVVDPDSCAEPIGILVGISHVVLMRKQNVGETTHTLEGLDQFRDVTW